MIKTEAVWKKIAVEMKSASYEFSFGQCKDKMKYIKCCYLKKIDNMEFKRTGSAPIKCEYFNELDNLFGKKPNVQPVCLQLIKSQLSKYVPSFYKYYDFSG